MKKLFLMLIAIALFSVVGYSQTTCPAGVTAITLNVPKPVTNGMKVGGITYCDPDNAVTVTQTLTPTIVETQTLYRLTVIGNSADIIVNDATTINSSIAASTVFTIKVTDNGTNPPNLSTSAVITINYVNSPPTMNPQTFSIAENSAVGTLVGTIAASDLNTTQTLTYSIVSGNVNSTFSINATTGAIVVTNTAALNYEATTTYALVIKVQDNGTPALSTQATMTINVTNVNEAPVIVSQ
jgi:hypothetical protein